MLPSRYAGKLGMVGVSDVSLMILLIFYQKQNKYSFDAEISYPDAQTPEWSAWCPDTFLEEDPQIYLTYFVLPKPAGIQPWCLLKVGTKPSRCWVWSPALKTPLHSWNLLSPPLTAKLQPAQWTLLYSSKPWLAQYSCLMEMAVSLFLKWFAQCEMGVLGTERCIADTTDRAKGFRDISCLLKGMARKRPTRFPLKCFSAGNQDMQPEFG